MTLRLVLGTATALALGASAPHLLAQGADYTQWRGADRDGSAASFTEPRTWPEQLAQRWKVEVGAGYATPLLVGDRVYMFARLNDQETMQALDAASGKVLWRTGYPAVFTPMSAAARHGAGPKSTPVFANGRLYSIGMTGIVTAWDAASGKQLWQKPGSEPLPLYTTHSFSPIVDGGNVIFHVGGHNTGALTAFDTTTGAVRWSWPGDGPGYGSPVIATLGGTRQLVTITQGKVIGINPATGTLLWEKAFVSANNTNGMTPVVHGQSVIVSGNGGPTVAFAVAQRNGQWTTETLWENMDSQLRFTNPVLVGNALIGMSSRNSGQYYSVDATSGKTLWLSEPRQGGNAAVVKAGNLVFFLEDDGELVVTRGTSAAFDVVKRYKVADSETWTQPAIAGTRFFVKDLTTLALWTLP
jgi:outer membrane protein assembly factor BamB